MSKQSIQEYLGVPSTWPVKENIRHSICLMPNAADIKNAKKRDPLGCALHNTACRVFDVPNAAIGGRWAYIPQRDAKGKYYIARMRATAPTQEALIQFDKTGKMPQGGFSFVPLTKSETYKNKRKYMKKWHKGEVGHNKGPRPNPNKRRIKTRTIPMNVKVGAK